MHIYSLYIYMGDVIFWSGVQCCSTIYEDIEIGIFMYLFMAVKYNSQLNILCHL